MRGYTRIPNVVLYDNRLSSDARIVYALLHAHTRPNNPSCWVSQERLVQLLGKGWNRRRVQEALYELRDVSLISCERKGSRRTNTYTLQPLPPELWIELNPSQMPHRQPQRERKAASQRRASDAPASETAFPAVWDTSTGMWGHLGNAHGKATSAPSESPNRAQRNYSSLRGGDSSSKSVSESKSEFREREAEAAASVSLDLESRSVQKDQKKLESLSAEIQTATEKSDHDERVLLMQRAFSQDSSDVAEQEEPQARRGEKKLEEAGHLLPRLGRQLSDGRWRCEHCGWVGSFEELLPRRFDGEPWLTYLCPDCRWLRGIAVLWPLRSPQLASVREGS